MNENFVLVAGRSDRLGLALAPAKPEPAEATAAESSDTCPQPVPAERDIFYYPSGANRFVDPEKNSKTDIPQTPGR